MPLLLRNIVISGLCGCCDDAFIKHAGRDDAVAKPRKDLSIENPVSVVCERIDAAKARSSNPGVLVFKDICKVLQKYFFLCS